MSIDHDRRPKSPTYPTSPISETSSFFSPFTSPHSIQMDKSVGKVINLKQDDEMFFNISKALLERYKSKKWNVKDAMDSVILPKERYPFWEALHWRMQKLPMFPEANEDPCYPILREVNRIFGELLRRQLIPSSTSERIGKHGFESRSHLISHDANKSLCSTIHTTAHPLQHPTLQHDTSSMPPNILEIKEFLSRTSPTSPLNYQVFEVDAARQDSSISRKGNPEGYFGDSFLRKHPHLSHASFPEQKSDVLEFCPPEEIVTQRSCEIEVTRQVPIESSKSNEQIQNHLEPGNCQSASYSAYPLATQRDGSYDFSSPDPVPKVLNLVHMNRSSRPRYQDYRPPSLHIPHSNSTTVEALPTHIDIDWNIPVAILNHDSPIRERTLPKLKEANAMENNFAATSVHESTSAMLRSTASPLPQSLVGNDLKNDGINLNSITQSESALPVIGEDIRSDIARRKYLLYIDGEQTTRYATEKSLNQTKRILDEIDHVNSILRTKKELTSDGKMEYESYQKELHHELERWTAELSRGKQVHENNDSLGRNHDIGDLTLQSKKETVEKNASSLSKPSKENAREKAHEESQKGKKKVLPIFVDDKTLFGPKIAQDPASAKQKHWRLVNVEAPCDLPEGFQFEARVGDEIFMATVPPGGVRRGDIFATRMGDIFGDSATVPRRTRVFKDMDAPPSRWRDELFDCFRHGICHPFLWNTIICPHVALAQIMARIQLSDTGDPVITIKSRSRPCSYVIFAFLLLSLHIMFACFCIFTNPDENTIIITTCPMVGLDIILLVYFLCMVVRTRKTVRNEFDIPELRCNGQEDICMALFCTCCTIAQMGRHTADYETFQSYCCTDTGLADHVEVKLPSDFLHDPENGLTNNSRFSTSYQPM